MKLKFIKILFILVVIILLADQVVCGDVIPKAPKPHKYVNDFAGILTLEQEKILEEKIKNFDKRTTIQIAVVTVKSLGNLTVENFAFELGEKWGVGTSEKDNGIVILIKPKYRYERGQTFIAVGYGLEGAVPDIYAKRIVNNTLIRNFKIENYFRGIDIAIDKLILLTQNENTNIINIRTFLLTKKQIILLLLIACILPFIYVLSLTFLSENKKMSAFYFDGDYNLKNLLTFIDNLESQFHKKFTIFKKSLIKIDKLSKGKLYKHSLIIDKSIIYIILNNQKRLFVFWKFSDIFLKSILLFLIIIGSMILFMVYFIGGVISLIFFLMACMFLFYAYLNFITYLISIYSIFLRKKNKRTDALSLALIAIKSLTIFNLKSKYNPEDQKYFYYSHTFYAPGEALTFSGSGGGYSGGGSSGGFGGGSFGGGGAGGSW